MNRQKFIKLIGSSLIETVKEAASPLFEEKLQQYTHVVDQLKDVTFVSYENNSSKKSQLITLHTKSILCINDKDKVICFLSYCPTCGGNLHLLNEEPTMKCFFCDITITGIDELTEKLSPLPIKKKGEELFIGIPKK